MRPGVLKRPLLLYAFALIFLLSSQVFAETDFDKQEFREFVKKEMKDWKVVGTAVLIVKDGKVIFSEGFGYRDLEKKLPVDSKTVFPIASCTKTFTSLAIGILADEGKVDLDKPIRCYYPELMMSDKYAAEKITLRDVLCHRSGLPRHDKVWMYAGLSRRDLMSKIRYLQPSYSFRERFQYNNIIYAVAGIVVEEITGMSWEDFTKDRIFKPLGMKSSSLSIDEMKKSDNFSLPYQVKPGKSILAEDSSLENLVERIDFQPVFTTGPSSSINSNLEDMLRWLLFHINEGKIGDKQIITKKILDEIHSPQAAIPKDSDFKIAFCDETPVINYSLGWVVQPFRGHQMLNHTGGIDGFTSFIGFMPRERIGVVVLTNTNRNMLPYIISFNIFDRLLGYKQTDRGKKFREQINAVIKSMNKNTDLRSSKKKSPHTHPIDDYTGKYTHAAYGDIIISKENEKLFATFRNKKMPMKHNNYDTFKAFFSSVSSSFEMVITFQMDEKGDITGLSIPIEPGVDDICLKKQLVE